MMVCIYDNINLPSSILYLPERCRQRHTLQFLWALPFLSSDGGDFHSLLLCLAAIALLVFGGCCGSECLV